MNAILKAFVTALLVQQAVNAVPFEEHVRRQAGLVPPSGTISIDPAYPTNVGYAGTQRVGQMPLLALNDAINTTEPKTGASVELRYTPLAGNGSASGNTSTPIRQLWGNTSPYFPSPLFADQQTNRQLNGAQCTLESVHILHRHGSRYPTSSTTEGAPFFGQVVANATAANNLTVTGPLSFLSNWTYNLGAELLVPLGAQEEFDSGVKHYYEYGRLYNPNATTKPVIRTTSQQRMLDSARYWTAGFFGLNAPNLIDLQVILEGDGFNNTLAPYDTCNNSNTITVGDTYLTPVWENTYLNDTVTRLQQYITKGITLTPKMVYGMQSLCAYETVGLGYSNFCNLFTEEEWQGFEYFLDLQFQGDYGAMSPNGRAQGIGYVQELLARLQNTTVAAANVTTQNTTLTPPALANQSIFVDFTHDDNILSVLTALNLTQVVGDTLSATQADASRTFVLSHITPFAARLVFEVANCGGQQIVRVILNDALIPLNENQGCASSSTNGTCALSDFVNFQSTHAVADANFDKVCFGVNGTDFTITGPTVTNGTVG